MMPRQGETIVRGRDTWVYKARKGWSYVKPKKRKVKKKCLEFPNCCDRHMNGPAEVAHALRGKSCVYCGDQATTKDHTVPRSRGGRKTVPCCRPCNSVKGDMDYDDWMLIVESGLLPLFKAQGRKAAMRLVDLEELRVRVVRGGAMVARLLVKQEGAGSSPASAANV